MKVYELMSLLGKAEADKDVSICVCLTLQELMKGEKAMTIKKPTDGEIIKALQCCISTTTNKACVGCPFNKQKLCDKDQWALERYALDLTNRQKTEIKKLKSENEILSRNADNAFQEGLNECRELFEPEIKAEAYKELAEKLENEINCRTTLSREQDKNVIHIMHNLLKEMVGEEE